jgi:UDP:flavonoid glycosyltransferase YjiC (YdhE family)
VVLAGTGQDKNLTNAIVDWKQVGVNLGTMRPSIDHVREGITKVLSDKKYKRNAVAMSRHFQKYDVARVFDGVIQGIMRKWQREQKRKAKTSHGCDGET